jgi:hypothetical protein
MHQLKTDQIPASYFGYASNELAQVQYMDTTSCTEYISIAVPDLHVIETRAYNVINPDDNQLSVKRTIVDYHLHTVKIIWDLM